MSGVRRLRENATEVASILVTGLWLALLLSGVGGNLWLVVLIVGYVVVVPLVGLLFGDEEDVREWWDDEVDLEDDHGSREADATDALETLRERYAAGELTEEQFERKLETLLETETLEDVETRVRDRGRTERDSQRERDLE